MVSILDNKVLLLILFFSILSCKEKSNTLDIAKELNLGNVSFNDTIKAKFPIVNTMDGDLIIKNTSTSCGCTLVSIKDSIVKPKDTMNLNVVFIPKSSGVLDEVTKAIVIETNAKQKFHEVIIKANVK